MAVVNLERKSGGQLQAESGGQYQRKMHYEYELRYCGNIYNSEFTTDRDLLDSRPFKEFVKMTQVNGIDIRGCSFSNDRSNKIEYSERGKGIYSLGAQFYVDDYCLDPNISPCQSLRSCSFEGLQYGIKALAIGSDKTVKINDAYFTSNLTGIYLSAVNEATLTLNYFEVLKADSSNADNYCGLYLDYCTGYTVEENFFTGDTNHRGALANSFGLVVKDSGEDYNEIYNNSFNYLDFGIEALNHNRSAIEYKGLVIKCNDFNDGVVKNIVVAKDSTASWINGIARYQGSNDDVTSPAGNLFNHGEVQGLMHIYNEDMPLIQYFMHDPDAQGSDPRVEPIVYVDTTTIDTINTRRIFIKSYACPSNLTYSPPDTIKYEMLTIGDKADSVISIYESMLDGGNTTEMVDDVIFSTPLEAYNIYNDLMSTSPYLSDTVLKESVEKEDVLNNAMITDILVANPHAAKSEKIKQAVESRNNQLSVIQKNAFNLGMNQISGLEVLEAEIAHFEMQRNKSLNKLLQYYINDTINLFSNDSLQAILINEDALSAKYHLAFNFLNSNDTSEARLVLDEIAYNFPLTTNEIDQNNQMKDYFELIFSFQRDGMTLFEADSTKTISFYSFLPYESGIIGAYSRNILQYLDLASFNDLYIIPNYLNQKYYLIPPDDDSKEEITPCYLKVYPNPAKNYCVLEYSIPERYSKGQIEITNILGNIIEKIIIDGNIGNKIISTKELNQGTFLCKIIVNGCILETKKLLILK